MTRHPTFNGRRVLLVEDEPRLREMLLRAVREMGFEPSGVSSAEQALRLLEQRPHPIIIVDLNLPAASGMDLIRTARARWPHIQAIILTGFGDLDAARQAIHLDVVDFLTKPCALGDLEVALDRAFHRLLDDHPTALVPTAFELEKAADAVEDPDRDDDHEKNDAVSSREGREPFSSELQSAQPMAFEPRDTNCAMSMEDIERRTILAVLEKHNGNRSSAAAELGISLRKLYYRLAQYQKRGLPLS